jgi:hypothetical protein
MRDKIEAIYWPRTMKNKRKIETKITKVCEEENGLF